MPEILVLILVTTAAGLCIPIGGVIASFEHIHPRWLEQEFRHFVVAFGGGILLGAVAVVLVPQGIESMDHSMFSIPVMLIGAIVFFLLERFLAIKQRSSPQLMGMTLDYVPEAMALGGLIAINPSLAYLLACLIGLQNLPEGFNTYRELREQNDSSGKRTLLVMLLLALLGPIAGLCGYFILFDHEAILGGIMLFASGGIIYLIFQDIAPQSSLNKHWAPPLGAVFGFCLALFSEMLIAGS